MLMQGRRILENLMFYNYNFHLGDPYHKPYSQILFVKQEYFNFAPSIVYKLAWSSWLSTQRRAPDF